MAPTIERAMPHNLEAERAVLGACLMRPESVDDALAIVKPGDFYRDAHRRIFEQVVRLHAKRVDPDLVTLKDALKAAGELDEVGGPVYLAELLDGVPRSTNVAHYAGIVGEKAKLRTIIRTAQKLYDAAFNQTEDAKTIIDQAEAALLALATESSAGGFRRLGTFLPGVLDQIEKWGTDPGGVTGLPTKIDELDGFTRGLQPQTLIVLAARPSVGKSALAINLVKNVASQGHPVGFVSLEMSPLELAIRALSDEGSIDAHWLQRGRLADSAWRRLTAAIGTLDGLPIYIDADPFQTVQGIRSRARRLKVEHGLKLLVVDYLQLIETGGRSDNRAADLAAVSRALKLLAKELEIPVIALSQLSRKVEERADHRPMLSDLRESGAIEQDADQVWFLHRPLVFDETPKGPYAGMDQAKYERYAELIIAKQRNGPTATAKLSWTKEYTRYADLDRYEDATAQTLPMGDR